MLVNRTLRLVLAGMSIPAVLFAQKKQFTMAEATNGMNTTLALKSIKQPTWEPGTNKLYQVVKTGYGSAWISTLFPEDRTDTVVRLNELNTALYHTDKLKAMPEIKWLDNASPYFINEGEMYIGIRTVDGFTWQHWITLPKEAEHVTVDKTRAIAYAIDNNLYMITSDKKTLQVTHDEDKNIVNGHSVHREEFNIDKGIFFSPDGTYLAYYRMDQRLVRDYPVINWGDMPAASKNIKYPMAGGTSHNVTVCVFNPVTGKSTTMLTEGPSDQYLTDVTWSPDEHSIFIAVLNRDQNHLWLNQYKTDNGVKVKTLFEETDPKYVEPLNELFFIPGQNDKFIWWSQRSGYMHLYLYNTKGKLQRQLTKGDWLVNDIVGTINDKHELIIMASKESPLEKHAYAVNWDKGKMRRLDKEPGTHTATPNESGSYILDVFTSYSVPKRSQVLATEGKYKNVILEAPNTIADYDRAIIKDVTLKAADGTPLYGRIILPPNFDSNKKYPVVVYLYNGPHVQLIKNGFPESGNLWYEYMAQRGYIMFTMDGRGSSNRGMKFEQATFRQLGTVEMEDQLKGVEYLKSLKYVDANRLGIHGWSFGGFMTTSMMLRHPGVFKVAVAGGPVMDWKMYEVMYTERYMDTPKDNPEGYENANLLSKVKNLQGKLLLIHGTDDITVVWQHSINFLKKAVDEGVQVDYFVYPGYEHNVRGKDRVHLMQKITDYFDQNLK